jgi:dephospho-CoA kinase
MSKEKPENAITETRNGKPFLLGVTGGIGSGKSVVCSMLRDLGARVFDADAQARRILIENDAVRREIVDAFGEASYDAKGELDRAYLAGKVFGDEEQVARINGIVHPRVFEAFQRMREQAAADGIPLLVHEAALLFESGGYRHLDAVAVVQAPEAERIRRVRARDGASEDQVRNRMKHQLPVEESVRRADFIIENTGSLAELKDRASVLYQKVTAA